MSHHQHAAPPNIGSLWRQINTGRVVVITDVTPNTIDGKPEELRIWHEGHTAKSRHGTSSIARFLNRYTPHTLAAAKPGINQVPLF